VNQGVWSFALLNGLFGHEKVTNQAASLCHSEVLVCSFDGHLQCRGSNSRPHSSQRGMDAMMASHSIALSRISVRTLSGLSNFVWMLPVRKLEIVKISLSEGLSWCNLVG
jgi:hypothetical protein